MRSLSRQIVVPGRSAAAGAGTGTVTHSAGALTADQLVIGNGADDLKALGAAGTSVQVLHGNAAGAPTFGAVSLTADVTGILPSANGGTGNGFAKLSGPAASEKTFTLPNASAIVLTDNAAVTIAQGGTGQTAKTAAFDGLSPTTTRGDLIVRDAANNVRLAKGTSGQYLSIGANDPAWSSVAGPLFLWGSGQAAGHSPVANTTYYFATPFTTNPGSAALNAINWVDTACTVKKVRFRLLRFGTAGTAGQVVTVSLRINDTTDVAIGTTDASATLNDIVSGALSTALAVGDFIQIKFVTPAVWTTPPTIVLYQAQVYTELS